MPDNRHFGKLVQWDKLQVFDPWIRQWERVIYLDAGVRVLDSVVALLDAFLNYLVNSVKSFERRG